jgi:membrane protein DedA with SNARE-associated domain
MAVTSVSSKRKKYIFGLFLGGIIAAFVVVVYYWQEISRFQHYGYPGLFVMGVLAGCPLPLPIPYMVVTFIFGGILNPALVGLSCGLGLAVGGTLLYLTGRGGHKFFPWSTVFAFGTKPVDNAPPSRMSRLVSRLMRWGRVPQMLDMAKRRGALVVFLMSAAINPFFVPMTIGIATTRYRTWKFFLMCWAGQTVKSLGLAYAGYLGLGIVLRWLKII